jgi:hypothetical protein
LKKIESPAFVFDSKCLAKLGTKQNAPIVLAFFCKNGQKNGEILSGYFENKNRSGSLCR